MFRLLLLLAVLAIAACGPADHTESGAITGVADDAKRARDSASVSRNRRWKSSLFRSSGPGWR